MNPQFAQIAPPNELSVLLTFQIRVARVDRRDGAVPAVPLDRDRRAQPDGELLLLGPAHATPPLSTCASGLDDVAIEVRAELGAVELRSRTSWRCGPGDVIRLGVPAEDGVRAVRRARRPTGHSRAATAGSSPCRCTSASRASSRPPSRSSRRGPARSWSRDRARGRRSAGEIPPARAPPSSARSSAPRAPSTASRSTRSPPTRGAPRVPVRRRRVEFVEGITGENMFVLRPDQVRALAAAMMGRPSRSRGRPDRDRALGGVRGDEPDDGHRLHGDGPGDRHADRHRAAGRAAARRPRPRRPAFGEARYAARFTLRAGAARGRRSCRSCRRSSPRRS